MTSWKDVTLWAIIMAFVLCMAVYANPAKAEPAKRVSMQAGKSYTSTVSTKWVPR